MSMTTSRATTVHHVVVAACVATLLSGCAAGAFQARPEDVPALEQQVSRAPADHDAATRLGAAYFHAGRYPDAQRVLKPLVAAGATAPDAALYLGLTQEKLEDWSGARASYTAFLAQGGSERAKRAVRERLVLVSRQELRQQARQTLEREQQLAQQPATPGTIAVLPFAISGLSEDLAPLQTALADMIVTDLSLTQLRAVERVRVQSILDEMRLGLGGLAKEGTAPRVGYMLRAENVVQGRITGGEAQQLAIATSVLNTSARTADDASSRSGAAGTIFDLEKQIVFDILDAVKYPLSAAERERITENRVSNLVAFLAYGRGLEAMDRGDFAQAREQFRQAVQLDPGFNAARTSSAEAQRLTQAAQTAPERVAQGTAEFAAPPAATASLTQHVMNELNPSLAGSMVGPGRQTQGGQTVQERSAAGTEQQGTPPISQVAPVIVILTVPRPVW